MNRSTVLQFPLQGAAVQNEPQPVTIPVYMPVTVLPVVRSEALTRYPDDAALIAALKRNNVHRICGIFDEAAWNDACAGAALYRLPLNGRAKAYLRGLQHEAAALPWREPGLFSGKGDYRAGEVVRKHRKRGDLMSCIFPGFQEWEYGETVQVIFPAPPFALMEVAQRARLAGCSLFVAAPASAIDVVDIERAIHGDDVAVKQKSTVIFGDPIVFGLHNSRVVGFGHYNISSGDSNALKALASALDAGAVDL